MASTADQGATILVAVDEKEGAGRPIACGLAVATALGLELVVAQVADATLTDDSLVAARRALEKEVVAAGRSATCRILSGRPSEAIADEARASSAAMIVIGQHRHSLWKDLFGTATVAKLMLETNRLVMVTHDHTPPRFDRILVAMDFSERSRRALQTAMDLFPQAEIRIVHAYDVPFSGFLYGQDAQDAVEEKHAQGMTDMLDAEAAAMFQALVPDLRGRCTITRGETLSVIATEAHDRNCDLLVIGARGLGSAHSESLGRVARALLEDPPCHTLAV